MTWVLNSLSWIFGHLPLGIVHALGRGFGFFAWLFSSRKKEIVQRISDSLDIPEQEAVKIQHRMYRNLGYTVAEFLRMPHMSENDAMELISFKNVEKLPEDHRYIALVAHTGNWELMGAATPLTGHGYLNIVVKSLKPSWLNDWVCKTRTQWGTRVHDRRGSSRNLLRVLKKKEPLGFILDQNAKNNWGVFVDFFGEPACTSDGLAQLAAISGYEIFPVFCRREPKTKKLVVEIGERISGPNDRSDDEIHRVTAVCTQKIEAFVRKYPDEWIWMHRRWRTKEKKIIPAVEKSE